MTCLIFTLNGRAELVEFPSERVLAAGSFKAVLAAARLLDVPYRFASLWEQGALDIRRAMDVEILQQLLHYS